jgi:predicted ATPase/DNA-binding SARP family transcriptional activator
MPRLALRFLRPPLIELDGRPVQLGRHKAVALLAYLALSRQPHTRDALATLLWPELDQSRARGQLRRTLSLLNRTLGDEWLAVDRETVEWAPDAEAWVDVEVLRERLAACAEHGHPPEQSCTECVPLLEGAVELYRDGFLAGFTLPDAPAFDEWQFFEGEGLREQVSDVLQRLARWHGDQGEYEAGIFYARRWLSLDPLHEPAQRELMSLYARSGQRAAALRQYAECERVLDEELGILPSPETTELYERIRDHPGTRSLPENGSLHNLPAQLTPFIGREALLGEIGARLADPSCRLLTLLGPGGSGKTRLALEAAARQVDAYAHGVWFVSLAPVPSAAGVVPAIAQPLGFSFHGEGSQEEQLIAYLCGKQVLLVLDTCEHLTDVGGLAARILEAAPQVKICATSRARLNVSGEQLYPVPGMDVPPEEAGATLSLRDAARYSALKLFVAGAQRVRPDFALSEDNLADVIRVCRLVEGMPLAILLAAAWIGTLSPAEIADEVGRSLDFLETDWRNVPARQRSMRAVFDHSWSLLGEREREVLAALSVFTGGFTREAAQRVVGASPRELMTLVNRSLVHRTAGGRYELHELLRQYAADKLATAPQTEIETRDRHCATYAAALERWEGELKGPRQLDAVAEIEADLGNARLAWDWAVERADVAHLQQAMDGLCRFYEWRGRYKEGEAACRAAADALAVSGKVGERSGVEDSQRVWAKATAWRGVFCRDLRRLEQGKQLLEDCLTRLDGLASAGQDVRLERAFALWQLGYTLYHLRDLEGARQRHEESLALYHESGERWGKAVTLYHLGDLLMWMGYPAEAEAVAGEGLAILRQLGDGRETAAVLRVLSYIITFTGRWEEGERLARESVAAFQTVGDRARAAESLVSLGQSLAFLGRLAEARARLEESVAVYGECGFSGVSCYAALVTLSGVEMYLGEYDQACASARKVLGLAQERGHRWPIRMALSRLCFVAIAKGEYEKVQQLCEPFRSYLTERLHYELAYVALKLGRSAQARGHIYKVLCIVAESGEILDYTDALPAVALFLVGRGELERAVELYALASRYPYVANSPFFEDIAGKDIAAAAQTLPPEVIEAAQARGRARDLEATVKELLVEFAEE